jgi:hypothetical protein
MARYRGIYRLDSDSGDGGIIAYLTREHGGNVQDRGIVEVAASSVHLSSHVAKNAVDLTTAAYFQSPNQPNQWFCYNFKDRRIRLTKYSIAAHTSNWFLRSWVVEGSVDGNAWVSLDERKDNTDAHPGHPIATFSVDQSDEYQFIRLRQTGKNAGNADWLILYWFEVFGFLTE